MCDLAESTGIAFLARDYFKTYNAASRASTCCISFDTNMYVPDRIQDIMDEFNDVKFIDEITFQSIKAEWFGSLRAMQAVLLPANEF